ncbi:MAG TPA: hypothetical protein VEL07_03765 [Planctomycetota bacterium]|nr:hypothetical protein [Planctomycetota bacterium]
MPAAVRTTMVEILTSDGRTAVLEESGWRCNDRSLMPLLTERAQIDLSVADPLMHAANLACYAAKARIVRSTNEPASGARAAMNRLGRALTDSSLQKALTRSDDINHRLGSEQLRNLKMNRLLAMAMWLVVLIALLVGAWYLLA